MTFAYFLATIATVVLVTFVFCSSDGTSILSLRYEASNSTVVFGNSTNIPEVKYAEKFNVDPYSHVLMRLQYHPQGYYTTTVLIGTPPQRFSLIVDTGSYMSYIICSATCKHCSSEHQDPWFDPESSSTYDHVQCTDVRCRLPCKGYEDEILCTSSTLYADDSSYSGVVSEDVIWLDYQSHILPQRALFSCVISETGLAYVTRANGIMGLSRSRGHYGLVDQLVDRGLIGNSFSICLGGIYVGDGALVLGHIVFPPGMIFTDSHLSDSVHYNVLLRELHVSGRRLPLDPRVFDGGRGTVFDSGTRYAYLPKPAYLAFEYAIIEELKFLDLIKDPSSIRRICFSGTNESDVTKLSNIFPSVDLVFENRAKLSLAPENYLYKHPLVRDAYCLGILSNEKDPSTYLGGIVMQNTLVMHDRENGKIGFLKTNCSQLWSTLNSSISSPALMKRLYRTSLGSKVESITFRMSFDIDYSELKPLMTVLTRHIAKELDVHISQLNLQIFTSGKNGSFTKWSITPAKPFKSMSNYTASKIISRIAFDINLPKRFGKHRIRYLLIETASDRERFQRSMLIVKISIMIIVLGYFALVIWRCCTHRNQTHSRND